MQREPSTHLGRRPDEWLKLKQSGSARPNGLVAMTELISQRQPFVADAILSGVATVCLRIASQTLAVDVNEDHGAEAIGVGGNETDCVSGRCRAVIDDRDVLSSHAVELEQLGADPANQRHLRQSPAIAG